MKKISIVGLKKLDVLIALYKASRPPDRGFVYPKKILMTCIEAEALLAQTTKFSYIFHRVLDVDLSEDEFDPYLYDIHNGEGAAEYTISELRMSKSPYL